MLPTKQNHLLDRGKKKVGQAIFPLFPDFDVETSKLLCCQVLLELLSKLISGAIRHEICQIFYTTSFLGQKLYTLKVRKISTVSV